LSLIFFSKNVKAPLILRPWADNAHVPFQHIDKLRQFVDLCPPQYLSKGQNAGIMFDRNGAGSEVGTLFHHGSKRDLFEVLPIL